jgi:hypothetical protein
VKIAWLILLISAATDFIINAGTSVMSAMVATGSATIPSKAVLVLAIVGGFVQMARTIQQALKAETKNANPTLLSKPNVP